MSHNNGMTVVFTCPIESRLRQAQAMDCRFLFESYRTPFGHTHPVTFFLLHSQQQLHSGTESLVRIDRGYMAAPCLVA